MKWLLRALLILTAFAVIFGAAGYLWLRQSLPELDGEAAAPGLAAEVDVVRDRWGVPHVYAQSQAEAAYGLGYAHAQDRLWQMELQRRIAAGRLSEALGAATLPTDRFLRALDFYRHVEQAWPKLDADTRQVLEAYAAGVNAYIATRGGPLHPLPPESLILGLEPEPWRPLDSLAILKLLALDLAGNWSSELLRFRLADRLSAKQINELFPPYRAEAPRGPALPQAHTPLGEGAGSNNWAVSGAHSATGKPLLANDPHLGFQAPSIWYFAHMSWPEHEVIGGSIPGLPAIVLGHNQRIAWAFTNTGPDVQDLYIEKLDPSDPGRYLTPDGSRPFERRRVTVKVKDAPDVILELRETRHGPVLSDVHGPAARAAPPGHVIALRWTALDDDDLTAQAGSRMALAQDWPGFVAALRDFHGPQQNVLYADIDGNIGFIAPARVPRRKPENRIQGYMPQPGWDAAYDWNGYIPFDELPRAFNPASGALATANNKIVPDDYPYTLTLEWAEGYRAQRIFSLLAGRRKHSAESFRAMQQDVLSPMAVELLPLLLRPEPTSERGRTGRELLRAWDGSLDANRPEPLIFAAWRRELGRRLYADELGDMFEEAWSQRPAFMVNVLSGRTPEWCDDVTTERAESCDEQVVRALDAALAWGVDRWGEDVRRWRWGEAHVARFRHRAFGQVPVLGWFFNLDEPTGGGPFTINAGAYRLADPTQPFADIHGPSMRAIYDLDDPDRSIFIHTTGQSGNPLSPLYRNFLGLWGRGEYIPMTTRRDQIEAGSLGRLRLIPAG
jgi:penicillin amidase